MGKGVRAGAWSVLQDWDQGSKNKTFKRLCCCTEKLLPARCHQIPELLCTGTYHLGGRISYGYRAYTQPSVSLW